MTKPIFVVGLPKGTLQGKVEWVAQSLREYLIDYHVICYESKQQDVVFNCFYEKDFTDVKYEELKQMVKDLMNKPNE